jgi:hypothetical protein
LEPDCAVDVEDGILPTEMAALNDADDTESFLESSSSSCDSDAESELSSDDSDSEYDPGPIEASDLSDDDDDESYVETELQCNLLRLQQQVLRLKKEKKTLIKKMKDMQHKYSGLTISDISVIREIKDTTTESHLWSCFMNDQIQNHPKKNKNGFRWNQEVIKNCIILHARGPGSYEYIRKSGMVLLPSPKTLRRYTGSSTADVGLTDLAVKALKAKKEELEQEIKWILGKKVHIVVDEVAIKPDECYLPNVDKFVGHVDMAGVVQPKEVGKLANKLLTFAINGLSHSFCIIVGYFLVANLTAEELCQLSKHMIKEVESVGYSIEGMVADNASINTKMFKMLNPGGKLSHVIDHPNSGERKFFVSFDSSHIIKNLRNQFIDRPLKRNGKDISFHFITRLHEKQKRKLLQPVRKLTQRHLEPTKIERQNVQRALDIFSRPMASALESYRRLKVSGFLGSEETISFLLKIIKWF